MTALLESVQPQSVELSPKCESSLNAVLSKLSAIFSNKHGKINSASHSIQVTNAIPVWSPSYSIPAKVEVGFHKALDELIDLDIIEPSTSKWSSPHIPIVKKDGDIRIVVEYRKLNAETVPEPFQMPTVDYIIASLGDAQFFSKLDLLKGFHQVPIVPESRPYTAFSCKRGK